MTEPALKERTAHVTSEWCGADRCTIYHVYYYEGKDYRWHEWTRNKTQAYQCADEFIKNGVVSQK